MDKSEEGAGRTITTINGNASVPQEIQAVIFNITGTDRNDILEKVANALQGTVGRHQVFSGASKDIKVGNYTIDVSTRKKKGVQTVTGFMAYETGNRKTIKSYYNKE